MHGAVHGRIPRHRNTAFPENQRNDTAVTRAKSSMSGDDADLLL